MTIPFETLRRKWMKDPKFRAEYERIAPDMEAAFKASEAQRDVELTHAKSEREANDKGTEPA